MRGSVVDKLPMAPKRLSTSGKIAWREFGTKLAKTGALQDIDLALFEQLANVAGWLHDLQKKVNDGPGSFAPTAERLAYEKKAKKWTAEYNQLYRIFEGQCKLFGMTPSSRSQVQPPLVGRQLSIMDLLDS
jgi:phage terminase small subunit